MATKLSQDEFDALVDAHELWVNSDGEKGSQLELKGKDLAGLDLAGRVLDKCVMTNCDLTKADLESSSMKDCRLDASVLDEADLKGANLSGAQMEGVSMVKASLVKVDADDSNFENAILTNVQAHHSRFDSANMAHADMREANFSDAQLDGANLEGAKLGGATFEDSSLVKAYMQGVNALHDMFRTNFDGTDLEDADLSDAKLDDCSFQNANLTHANFSAASLDQSEFDGANASRTDFTDSTGRMASWPDEMESAVLTGSTMHPMHASNSPGYETVEFLVGMDTNTFVHDGEDYVLISTDNSPDIVIVTDSDFWVMAHSLAEVPEEEANMSFWEDAYAADVNDIFVRYAAAGEYATPDNMEDVAILSEDVTLDFVEEAIDAMDWDDIDASQNDIDSLDLSWLEYNNPQGVQISGNYRAVKAVEDWLEEYESPEVPEVEPRVSYGKQRKAVGELRKVTQPMKLAAFKKTFPAAFDSVKDQLRKQTIDPDLAKQLIDQFGMTWQVSMTDWHSSLQRLAPDPNEVLQFNVDLAALTTDEDLLKTLLAMRKLSRESLHPVVSAGALMTVGWVRFASFPPPGAEWPKGKPKVLLVEEVQSDLPAIRKAVSDDTEFRRKLEEQGGKERVDAALDLMAPFVARFYHDALAAIFDLAAERNIDRVEMFTHDTKKQFGSPMNVYEKLPKSMGMKKISKDIRSGEYLADKAVPKIWAIQVISDNPRRRNRKHMPKTWTRHQGYR